MIDSLLRGLAMVGNEPTDLEKSARKEGLAHVVVTLHRPGNVDSLATLAPILLGLERAAQRSVVLFPIHPRTAKRLEEQGLSISMGTNELIPRTPEAIGEAVEKALSGRWKKGTIPPLWDGRAASRIVDALLEPRWLEEARARG
jgi:UDP-N-acetylglucosamine 2-epimerase